jgi:hypothetical protein
MATQTKTVIDAATGEVTIEDFTAEDQAALAQMNLELKERDDRMADKEALLAKLGITAEEAALLLG